MKKILPALILISFLAVLVTPMVALAQEGVPDKCVMTHDVGVTGCPTAGDCVYADNNLCGLCCLLNVIYTVVDWIFIIMIAVAVLFVILGAYQFLTAAGSPEKISSGRNYVLYAAVGLIVAFLARAIPAIVKAAMGY